VGGERGDGDAGRLRLCVAIGGGDGGQRGRQTYFYLQEILGRPVKFFK